MAQSSNRRISYRRILAGAVFLVLIAALGSGFVVKRLFFSSYISQTSGPMALEEVSRQCPIPLPATAKNIQYAVYSQWQAYEAFVRFEAPVADCLSHVNAILKYHKKQNATSDLRIELKPIDPSCLVVDVSALPSSLYISWFDLERIKRGQWGGESSSYAPRVWIDEDRGIFYYRISD